MIPTLFVMRSLSISKSLMMNPFSYLKFARSCKVAMPLFTLARKSPLNQHFPPSGPKL
jgi:hypothetical protein